MVDKPEAGKLYSLTGGHGTPSIASGNTWAESEVKDESVLGVGTRQTEKNKTDSKRKYKINVDLDASREEAEHLESLEIVAQDEEEALEKADEIVKKQMYGGPYYNVSEIEND